VLERLGRFTQTPGASRRCSGEPEGTLFAPNLEAARALLEETGEARAWLTERSRPFGAMVEIGPAVARAARGGVLRAEEILAITGAAETIWAASRALAQRCDEAPRLFAHMEALGEPPAWVGAVRRTLDEEGRVLDGASPLLADARARVRRLGAELQRRLQAALHDPSVAPYLSDSFVTLRGGRYVLPVRADARSRVSGIVHDASSSGTTLFVEPDAAVATNNQLRESELEVARETERILHGLSQSIGHSATALRAGITALEAVDLAFARGALALEYDAVAVTLEETGGYILPGLRHPLLPRDEVVPNDLALGQHFSVLVLSGPNAGGKTVAMKALALAVLGVHAGLQPCALPGARVEWTDALLADIGDAQSLREHLSTFSAHLRNLASILAHADPRSLVLLDEIGDGTDPGEGAALAQAVLEGLVQRGARAVVTTHYNLLKELAAADSRFENASFDFDPETLAPMFRLRLGTAGVSSATALAARMGLPGNVLARAHELLDREDRRLEHTLATLNESRLALERERQEAAQLKAESAAERDALRAKLEHLQAKRDRLYDELRSELELSFREAHEQVANVIRALQQRGRGAREAERARRTLVELERGTRAPGGALEGSAHRDTAPHPIDWQRARPGQRVRLTRGGDATLVALPDRRGRAAVQVGAARILVPAEQIGVAPDAPAETGAPERVRVEREDPGGGLSRELDLRGSHVDEALERLDHALDRAASAGQPDLRVVHGIGTGALLRALREALAHSPYVAHFEAAAPDKGGEGATEVTLRG